MLDRPPRRVLPVIVLSQFAGTSLWFAVNAVMPDLQRSFGWPAAAVATLTSAVQLGFIAGTLVFALLAVADRFSPRTVFLACGARRRALCNAGRRAARRRLRRAAGAGASLTGFCLAGIYPVGMKIAARWYPARARRGARAAGRRAGARHRASRTRLRALSAGAGPGPWCSRRGAGVARRPGCWCSLLVPEPPHAPARRRPAAARAGGGWLDRRVRASVLGYFGHMWELYAIWVLVPADPRHARARRRGLVGRVRRDRAPARWAARGGLLAQRVGSARVAGAQLALSGAVLPGGAAGAAGAAALFALWLLLWGVTVVGRLAAVLGAHGRQCAAGAGRQRADARQQHRLRDLDPQHRAVRRARRARLAGGGAALARARAAARRAGAAPAADAGDLALAKSSP